MPNVSTKLHVLRTSAACSFYELPGESVSRFVASTPQSRNLCNDPSITGVEFTNQLQRACVSVLKTLKKSARIEFEEKDFTVLHYIPGSLVFGVREALYEAYELNKHSSLFVSGLDSEGIHFERKDKRPSGPVSSLTSQAVVVFGDIVVTGNTFSQVFERIIFELSNSKRELYYFLFITLGSYRAEELLSDFDTKCRKLFPHYQGAAVVYLEGRFNFSNTGHLLRSEALLAPEFFNSQYDWAGYPLEQCALYDAVMRAFSVSEHLKIVLSYWENLLKRAEEGLSYEEVLAEKFPNLDRSRFKEIELREVCLLQIKKLVRAAS